MQSKCARSVLPGLTFLVSANFFAILHLCAESSAADQPDPPYARVSYSKANSVVASCRSGVFDCVGVQPDQIVQVTVQYPSTRALQKVILQTLDGGTVRRPSVTSAPETSTTADRSLLLNIAGDGTVTFEFRAGNNPGLNQISLRQGSQELGLQFWVLDPQNPQNKPPVLTPDKPTI